MKKILFFGLICLMFGFNPCAQAISFVEQYDYDAGEADSKLTCRSISLLQVKRILVERLGTYLESNTVVTDHQITRDEIVSFSAGIVKTEILEESWDGKIYRLKARVEANPKWFYYYHRGRAYRKTGEYRKSLKDFNTVVQIDSGISRVYFERGATLIKMGKKRKGVQNIRKAASMGNGDAKRWLKLKKK